MSTPTGTVLLKPVQPVRDGLRLALVGEDKLSGGVAAWGTLDRPRRRSAVEWTGTSGFTYVLPLLLDGMETTPGRDTSVEAACRTLMSWGAEATKATRQPVVLKATGPLQTPENIRWVISGIDWGTKFRNAAGQRVQQYAAVTLTEYVAASVRHSPAKASRDRKDKD